jgi:hypothetical protein
MELPQVQIIDGDICEILGVNPIVLQPGANFSHSPNRIMKGRDIKAISI